MKMQADRITLTTDSDTDDGERYAVVGSFSIADGCARWTPTGAPDGLEVYRPLSSFRELVKERVTIQLDEDLATGEVVRS